MIAINGISLKSEHFPKLSKVADLLYYEGPLLSLFRTKKGDHYIYYWCDSNATSNRWLVFQISEINLNSYLSAESTFLQLIKQPSDGFLYCLDLNNDLSIDKVSLLNPESLPIDYLPGEDSFYKDKPMAVSNKG